MKIRKVTTGYVVQEYDTDIPGWASQFFVAGEVEWENEIGESFDDPEDTPAYDDYLEFDMVQPTREEKHG